MTVRTRLVLAVLSATLIMALPAVFALSQLDSVRDAAVTIRERHAAAGSAVGEMRSALADVDLAARGYAATGSPAARDRLARAVSAIAVASGHLRETGYGETARPTVDMARAVRAAAYQVGALAAEGNLSEATVAFRGLSRLLSRADPVLAELDAEVRARSAESARRAERRVSSATRATTIALIGALLLAFLVGGGGARTVTRPLSLLESAMARVAEGELQAPGELEYDRDDELGSLNRTFRFMTEKLEELDRIKAEFLSAASHKLKTPVSVVLGYGEMLSAGEFGPVNEEQREVLDEVREQMEELTGQIEQLIRLTRAEAGALELDFRETHVEDLASALRRAFSAAARQKEAEYRVEIDADAPRVIRADEERLRDLVLGNLLDNAFKYIERGDGVELRIAAAHDEAGPADGRSGPRDAGWVSLEVRDTGPGIAPEELEEIFEPYVRSEEVRDALGTGVGLAIARQVVRAHGGRITAESERGTGTRFVVRIPVAGPSGSETHSSGASALPVRSVASGPVQEVPPVQPPRPDLRSEELAASWREFRSAGEEAQEIAGGLTPDQLWWRPSPERWSVGECLDHLVRTGEVYLEALDAAIDEGRRRGLLSDGPGRRSLMGRWLVRFLEPPPGLSVPAPGRILPRAPETEGSGTGGDGDPLSDFLALRPELADRLQAADGLDLGRIRMASPFAWFLRFDLGSAFRIVAAHERRHLWQARRVCESEGFPRR